jgi:hypothetical protein
MKLGILFGIGQMVFGVATGNPVLVIKGAVKTTLGIVTGGMGGDSSSVADATDSAGLDITDVM